MQQSTTNKDHVNRTGRYFSVIFALLVLTHLCGASALAKISEITPCPIDYIQPEILLALADPPDFLSCDSSPSPDGSETKDSGMAITPFLGQDQALTSQSAPTRPAITAAEKLSLDRPEVTAGVNVDLGTFRLNLGYTLPASQVDNFVRPLGVDLEPGTDIKRFSLGVKIPF